MTMTRSSNQRPQDLRQIPLFASLDPASCRQLQQAASWHRYRPGTIIYQAGEPARGLYIVVSGTVKQYRLSEDGHEQILSMVSANQIFGEIPVFQGGHYPTSTQCITQADVVFLDRTALLSQLERDPALSLKFLSLFASKQRRLLGLIEDLTLRDAHGRLCHYLYNALQDGREGNVVRLPASQVTLARMLGITSETMSRTLKQLRVEGLIETEGRGVIRVLDMSALRRAAGESQPNVPPDGLVR